MNEKQNILYKYILNAYTEDSIPLTSIIWGLQDGVEYANVDKNGQLHEKRWKTKYYNVILNSFAQLDDTEVNEVIYAVLNEVLPKSSKNI